MVQKMTHFFKPLKPIPILGMIPSEEQQNILKLVAHGKCVKIIAGAGTAKSTTCMMIAADAPDKKILILTYGRELNDENVKIAEEFKLSNVTCSTIHSILNTCIKTKINGKKIHDDTDLLRYLEEFWQKNINLPSRLDGFDVIMIDEIQDMRPSYYQALCFILPESKQLLTIGDVKQMLYDYGRYDAATPIFLTDASHYFRQFTIGKVWTESILSVSFRLTPYNAKFVNMIWGTNLIAGNTKDKNLPVEYRVMNPYGKDVTDFLKEILDTHKPEEVLLQSHTNTKSSEGKERPLGKHLNRLMAIKYDGKQKYFFYLKDTSADGKSSIRNKIRVFTFCSSKGLTVKTTIIFGFNSYQGRAAPLNQMGVALSRAKSRLILIHLIDYKTNLPNPYYPGLNSKVLQNLVEAGVVIAPDGIPHDTPNEAKEKSPIPLTVTSMTHQSAKTLKFLLSHCTVDTFCNGHKPYDLVTKKMFSVGLLDTEEEFSSVYGCAIPFAVEHIRKNKISNVEQIINNITLSKVQKYTYARLVDELLDNVDLPDNELEYIQNIYITHKNRTNREWMHGSEAISFLQNSQGIHLKSLTNFGILDKESFLTVFPVDEYARITRLYQKNDKDEKDYMILANAFLAYAGTHETFLQMGQDYSFTDKEIFLKGCHFFLEHLPCDCEFEQLEYYDYNPHIKNANGCFDKIVGKIDAISKDKKNVYELKFTNAINDEHKLQTMLYCAIVCLKYDLPYCDGTILNGKTSEILHVKIYKDAALLVLKESALTKLGSER